MELVLLIKGSIIFTICLFVGLFTYILSVTIHAAAVVMEAWRYGPTKVSIHHHLYLLLRRQMRGTLLASCYQPRHHHDLFYFLNGSL